MQVDDLPQMLTLRLQVSPPALGQLVLPLQGKVDASGIPEQSQVSQLFPHEHTDGISPCSAVQAAATRARRPEYMFTWAAAETGSRVIPDMLTVLPEQL